MITYRAVGNKKSSSSGEKEWMGFAAMSMMHLNSRVRQFGGFAPGQRVFGRAPKCRLPRLAIRILCIL